MQSYLCLRCRLYRLLLQCWKASPVGGTAVEQRPRRRVSLSVLFKRAPAEAAAFSCFWGLIQVNMRSVLRASGIVAAVFLHPRRTSGNYNVCMSTYTLYVCVCVCKKKRQSNTIFSGLYCFRVHCAKLEKNNNSDNKLDLVIRNASICPSCVLVKFNLQVCGSAAQPWVVFLTSCGPPRCSGSIPGLHLLRVLATHLPATLAGGLLAGVSSRGAAGRWRLVPLL